MSKYGILAIVAAALVVAGPTARAAQPGEVMMGDTLLLRIRSPLAGYTTEQRAEAIQKRVNDLLVIGGFDLDTVIVEDRGNYAVLYANNSVLVTVDETMAKQNNTTPLGLANVWAQRLREAYPRVVPVEPPAQQTEPQGQQG